jgi:16S rRNA processing protein RimM
MPVAGVVGRPHGLDGSFYVNAPRGELLVLGTAVGVGELTATIERLAGTAARPIVRLSICNNRGEAEALRGSELSVVQADAPPLGPDEYRAEELIGARVTDGKQEIGVVSELRALPSCDCLTVMRSDGSELLVPMVHDAIRAIDTQGRVIDVDRAFLGEP